MKIVIDPIYTSDPSHCASNVKMKKIVEYLLPRHPDLFVYWLVPPSVLEGEWEEHRAFYPADERVQLIAYPYSKDRMKEYLRVDRQYYDLLNFQGVLWDADIVITNRTSMVPHLIALMNKPGRHMMEWMKRVFLIEDMPLMDFKLTVPLSAPVTQEIQTLAGYLAAHTIAVSAFWEKEVILHEAKKHLSASSLRYIGNRMIESSPVHVEQTEVKTKASVTRMLKGERPFTIGFVGRMTQGTRCEDIFSMMGKHWVYRAGKDRKIRCMASTQSIVKFKPDGSVDRVGRSIIPEWMEIKRLPREGFWDLMRNEVDCFVFMSPEEDYSMSLMEPLILGCPAILVRTRWSEPTVGKDYPFFVDDMQQAYAMVRAFYEDYAGMYKKFVAWSKEKLTPLLRQRNEVYVPLLVEQDMAQWRKDFADHFDKYKSAEANAIVKLIAEHGAKTGELVIFEAIEALEKQGKLRHLASKTDPEFTERIKITFGTDWNVFRLGLMLHGWRDASTKVGHMKKDKQP